MERLSIEGIQEFWYHPTGGQDRRQLAYRPAILLECSINFRSLRAGLNHSEERSYSAWLPEADLAIDWDTKGGDNDGWTQVVSPPGPNIGYRTGRYKNTK